MPSFPRTPFFAGGFVPPRRSGQVSPDEAEPFLHNRVDRFLRSDGVRVYPGMPFGFPRISVQIRRNPHVDAIDACGSRWGAQAKSSPRQNHVPAPKTAVGAVPSFKGIVTAVR